MKSKTVPKLLIGPLTAARWEEFETLFGLRGACGGCWGMTPRLTPKRLVQVMKGLDNVLGR